MEVLPADTVAYHEQRSLNRKHKMSDLSCAKVAQLIKQYIDTKGKKSPEGSALWFYGMNHGMSEITKRFDRLEPLPADVLDFVDHYYTQGADEAMRAVAYLVLICVRESRHLKNKSSIKNGIIGESDLVTYNYISTVPDSHVEAQAMFAQNPPATNLVTFVKGCAGSSTTASTTAATAARPGAR